MDDDDDDDGGGDDDDAHKIFGIDQIILLVAWKEGMAVCMIQIARNNQIAAFPKVHRIH